MRRISFLIFLVALSLLTCGNVRAGGIDTEKAAKVKAAFLLNFIKFTQWPADALPPGGGAMVVVIVGDNDLGGVVEATLRGREHLKRSFVIERIDAFPADAAAREKCIAHLRSAQAVYVSANTRLTRDELNTLNAAAVLTVGATPDVQQQGTILSFGVGEGRILFHHNAEARTPLQLSSKLLALARPLM